MSALDHLWCPACGWFGRRKRRRARDAADAALVAFHARLAAEVRAEREAERRRNGPLITLLDRNGVKIAGPLTAREFAEAGVMFG
ncbi:hypothetical protein [Mycobacterium aquaticum]|uniref:Uncharacterized protein n=1 Tax=Mycobacterium aquaticum TaxID=1927124 RepID=A0A1X0A5A7_9MYCO|nr:hypothetical protein [Mycobacterium aquaticum]ORA24876.1 hypothetical protein BST13_33405 [Mycobacterium aquaticum]